MSGTKTEKQLITTQFNPSLQKKPAVNFDVDRFDSAIFKHGYNVNHHRALRCPCVNKGTGSALPDCENCRGIGWFYIDKKRTKALMQNMRNSPKHDSWTEKNAGTTQITTLYDDDVTYMDKFEIVDLEANFTQVLQPVKTGVEGVDETIFAFTIYEPLEIMNIYLFVASNCPLIPLKSKEEEPIDWDYELSGNKIVFNIDKYIEEYEAGNLSVSVRYKHLPIYCVIDIQRELFKAKDQGECSDIPCDFGSNDLHLRGMPQKSIGRRLHYVWDSNNQSEPSVFDNTVYE